MPTKFELEKRAKVLIDSDPNEAVVQYHRIWDEYGDKFNEWDAFYSMRALQKASTPDLKWARELALKYNDQKVRNQYSRLVFDHINRLSKQEGTKQEILSNEDTVLELLELSPQNDARVDDKYPCWTTIAILKLADEFSKPQFNSNKINSILDHLNITYLSSKTGTAKTEERGDIELASNLERFHALKTKALLRLKEFIRCKELCENALSTITTYHYDNDLWFRMRIAICDENLGNLKESEEQFQSLLSTKAGSDKWFLHRDISELYFEQGDYEKAWKFAVSAALNGNDAEKMYKLFHLQAQILYKLDRPGEGKILAELIASIIKEQQWRTKDIYSKLISFYEIDTEVLKSSSEYLKAAQAFWTSERYAGLSKIKGEIVSIHNNGKVGKIRDEQERTIGFHRKDFVRRPRDLSELVGASVVFYVVPSFEGRPVAKNIVVTKNRDASKVSDLIGTNFIGVIKKIVEFGLFVKIDGHPDALLHKSNIPRSMRGNLSEAFHNGQRIKVEVSTVTEKGMQLKYVDFT